MDEFLRSASHQLVTGTLLVVWSGVLIGITWKIFELAWAAAREHLPRETAPVSIREIFLEYPRLDSNHPEPLLAETAMPQLPPPPQAPHLFISLFQKHKEPK